MSGNTIALVTAASARDLDEDLVPLQQALQRAGAAVTLVDWDDTAVDWAHYDLAIVRSTWDYTTRLREFLDWAQRAAGLTRLLNPYEVLRWNTDKHYLDDLARAGVPVVPSFFLEPGQDVSALPGFDEFVVKPAVGAGSRDAQRYLRSERAAAEAHAQRLLDAGRSALLQPYLAAVDAHGESALIYTNGRYSHSIRKGPLLQHGASPTRALFAAEHISTRQASAAELAVAERALAAIPFASPLLYARVDLLPGGDGEPCVLELELAEPSLYFAFAEGSLARFAAAIQERLGDT